MTITADDINGVRRTNVPKTSRYLFLILKSRNSLKKIINGRYELRDSRGEGTAMFPNMAAGMKICKVSAHISCFRKVQA